MSLYAGNLEDISLNLSGDDAIESQDSIDDIILDAGT